MSPDNLIYQTGKTGWRKGPLPPDTYFWGGAVPFDHEGDGFYFADFGGDHVTLDTGRVLKAHEVAWYNNDLGLPPNNSKSATRIKVQE